MSRWNGCLGAGAVALACAMIATVPVDAGAASGPLATAAGTHAPARAQVVASRGFRLYNLSSHPLKLISVGPWIRPYAGDAVGDFSEGRPEDGAVLDPGAPPHVWELKYNFFSYDAAKVEYSIVGTKAVYTAYLEVNTGENNSYCRVTAGACTAEGLTLTVTDPPGTVHDIPAGQGRQQAQTLRDLCTKTSSATCDFTPTGRQSTNAPTRLVGNAYANCTEGEQETRFTAEDKVGVSNSIGIEVGTEFETNFIIEKAKVSIKTKYQHEWTEEHTFSQEETLRVRPGYIGWVSSTSPVIRDTGDFMLKLGNTTWNLPGVSFDTPNPAKAGHFVANAQPMTAEQKQAECADMPPGDQLTKAPASLIPMHRSGTGAADVLVGGRTSDAMRGLAGADVLRGGPGNDTLHGGPGNDTLHGGPGNDTLGGGPGADTLVDHSGATLVRTGTSHGPGRDTVDVRDGHGDDTVVCGSRGSVVTADRGDRVSHCGDVIRGAPTGRGSR